MSIGNLSCVVKYHVKVKGSVFHEIQIDVCVVEEPSNSPQAAESRGTLKSDPWVEECP